MSGFTKNIVSVVIVHFILMQGSNQISFRQRYFKFEHAGAGRCPGNSSSNIAKVEKLVVNQPDKFHHYVNAKVSFFRNITAPIKFRIRSLRYSLDSTSTCLDNHKDGTLHSLCEHLNDENALWTPFLKSFHPKLHCPIKTGTYKTKNATVDFSAIALLPLEGFRYTLKFKFYEMAQPKPLDILCLDFTVAITFATKSRRRGKSALP